MTADPVLAPHDPAMSQAAVAALVRIEHHLPAAAEDVVITHSPFVTIPELGLGGLSPKGHLVQVSVDPAHPNFRKARQVLLSRTLAHELHLCTRWRGLGYGSTLM